MLGGHRYTHYPSCQKQNILRISDSCDSLTNYGGLILENDNRYDATVDLNTKFYRYYSAYKFLENKEITYYEIDNHKCIVLDATAGKYGYPGYDANPEE
ncbi:MAG: hypothetical protein KAT65_01810 [Methanophagales archaeon]|nr:hypothetical protein [Methanophagales archaeon]